MTIEETRAQAVSKLGELKKIVFTKPTALELHSRRPMLAKVQRQEQKRYKKNVIKQKKKLTKDISDIDIYLASQQESVVLPVPYVVFKQKPVLKKTKLPRYKRRGRY